MVGVPDGLTEEFVYEFKTTKNRFLYGFIKPVAFAQADLYGLFFQRLKKRIQIYVMEDESMETFEEKVDVSTAENTLQAIARVDGGEHGYPPKPWKCKNCNFRGECPIGQ